MVDAIQKKQKQQTKLYKMNSPLLVYIIGFAVIVVIGISFWAIVSDDTLRKWHLEDFIEDKSNEGRGILITFAFAFFWPILVPVCAFFGSLILIIGGIVFGLIKLKRYIQKNKVEDKIKSLWKNNTK